MNSGTLVNMYLYFCVTGDSGVWGLKKNFALIELLEKLQFSQAASRTNNFTKESLAKQEEVTGPCFSLLQIRRGNRDSVRIISHISP